MKTSAAVVLGSTGSFMAPPDYPDYYHEVRTDLERSRGDQGRMSVSSAVECDHISDAARAKARELLDAWNSSKLPEGSERVEAWTRHVYGHLGHCYEDKTREKYGKPEILIWPPSELDVNLALIDAGFLNEKPPCGECCKHTGHERRLDEKRVRAAHEIKAKWAKIATPENHLAVKYVRRYYPEHAPRLDLIGAPLRYCGHWYGTEKERPTADNCPGDESVSLAHTSREWCQWCGRDSSAKD